MSTVKQFIDAWNSLPTNSYCVYSRESIDELYLYLHGGKGALYFYKEDMYLSDTGECSFSSLKNKRIKWIALITCCGGEGFEGENLAWFFSGLTGAKVFACSGKVSFNYDKGLHIFRPRVSWKTPFALFKTFWYEWDGRNKAKERIGLWY